MQFTELHTASQAKAEESHPLPPHRLTPAGGSLAGLAAEPAGEVVLIIHPDGRGDLADGESRRAEEAAALLETGAVEEGADGHAAFVAELPIEMIEGAAEVAGDETGSETRETVAGDRFLHRDKERTALAAGFVIFDGALELGEDLQNERGALDGKVVGLEMAFVQVHEEPFDGGEVAGTQDTLLAPGQSLDRFKIDRETDGPDRARLFKAMGSSRRNHENAPALHRHGDLTEMLGPAAAQVKERLAVAMDVLAETLDPGHVLV